MPSASLPPAGRYQLAGRYRLDTWIAAGGVGEVWRAVDIVLDRAVAVKLLRQEYVQDAQARTRFRAEARHAGGLSHSGIAQVYDYGESQTQDPPFLVMELVDGPSLATVLADGPLDPGRAMDVIAQTAAGLQAAHQAGLIHRDIKPANLLLTPDGQVKITDFGIAYAVGSAPVTRTGLLVGTPAYLAPERAMGASATAASDLYSLGIVAFECLTGTAPFTGVPLEVATAHRHRPLPELPSDVPPRVAQLVEALTSKDPAGRPASAGQVAEQAAQLRDDLPRPAPVPWPAPAPAPASAPASAGRPIPADPPAWASDLLAAPESPAAAPPARRPALPADTEGSPAIGDPPGSFSDDPLGLAGGSSPETRSPRAPTGPGRSPGTRPGARPPAWRAGPRPGKHASRAPGPAGETIAYPEPRADNSGADNSGADDSQETLPPGSRPAARHVHPTLAYSARTQAAQARPIPLGPRGLAAAALGVVVLVVVLAVWLLSGHHSPASAARTSAPRPAPGAAGTSVVRVSPELAGQPGAEVARHLQRLGLRVRFVPQPDFAVPPGTVLGIRPLGVVRPRTLITLTVARAPDRHPFRHGHGHGHGNGHGNGGNENGDEND